MILTAQTIQQIATQIYHENDLWDIAKHYSKCDFEDIIHEVILQIYTMSPRKVKQLYKMGVLKYYIIYIIKTSATSPSSGFQKKYYRSIKTNEQLHKLKDAAFEEKTIEERQIEEDFYNKAATVCTGTEKDKRKQYILRTIFELYFENNLSIRQIAKCSKLSTSTVYNYLKVIKENIKNTL